MKREFLDNEKELAEAPGGISVREAGARGGHATLESQGVDFFKRIGRRGGQRTAELYAELLKDFGKCGGRPRRPTLDENLGEERLKKEGGRGRPRRPSPAQL